MKKQTYFAHGPPMVGAVASLLFALPARLYWDYQLVWPFIPATILFVVIAAALVRRGWVTLDDEGVTERTGLFTHFIPYEFIARARRRSRMKKDENRQLDGPNIIVTNYVQLTLTNGDVIDLPSRNAVQLSKDILERKYRASVTAKAEPPAALARNRRSIPAWIEALRSITTERPGYRDAPLSVDALWNIVESRWQAAEARAAAAVALAHRGSPETRQRLARVAAAAESPRLRIVIKNASSEAADEALEESLAALAD